MRESERKGRGQKYIGEITSENSVRSARKVEKLRKNLLSADSENF